MSKTVLVVALVSLLLLTGCDFDPFRASRESRELHEYQLAQLEVQKEIRIMELQVHGLEVQAQEETAQLEEKNRYREQSFRDWTTVLALYTGKSNPWASSVKAGLLGVVVGVAIILWWERRRL